MEFINKFLLSLKEFVKENRKKFYRNDENKNFHHESAQIII